MYEGAYQEYVDNEILTASPARLVQIMYRGAIDAVAAARSALAGGDIAVRSRNISKAHAILNEMALSLNHSLAPELTRNLVELYDYMARRLLEANAQQSDEPLAEVQQLLNTLLEAWLPHAGSETAAPAYVLEPPAEYEAISYAW
jgi:flagellar secretion chaperone FliS